MTSNASAERLRKVASGLCLVLAPLGLATGVWLHPKESYDAGEQLTIIGQDAERWATAHWIIAASALLFSGAALALAHLLHDRRPGHAIIGGAMAVIGSVSLAAVAFSEGSFAAAMGAHADDPSTVAAFTAATTGPAFTIILIGALLGPLGTVVLGLGALRAGVAARWAAAATALGAAVVAVSLPINAHPVTVAGSLIQAVGLIPIGIMILGETDDEWARPPTHLPEA